MNQNSFHIDFEKITDFVIGTISDVEKNTISEHLAVCPSCLVTKNEAENVISLMKNDQMEEVPSYILERSFDLLREKRISAEKPSFIKRIIANFTPEVSTLTPEFGLRSEWAEPNRRLWLQTEELEIDLRLQKIDDNWQINGQVFGDFLGGEVFLISENSEFNTKLNELFEFSFSDIPNGNYKLLLKFAELEIETSEIIIK